MSRYINWKWIAYRFRQIRRCSHEWTTGDRVGHQACGRCGVWRWFPVVNRGDK
jgi:hypothetical protein